MSGTGCDGSHAPSRTCADLSDLSEKARELLPAGAWEMIAGAAGAEVTAARNRSALDELCLRPRLLRDLELGDINLRTCLLGEPVTLPIFLSPAGGQMVAHPDGECASAIAAARQGTIMAVSTWSSRTMEDVAAAQEGAPLWFQLYHRGYDVTMELVNRAVAAGYGAIVLTVDVPVSVPAPRTERSGWVNPHPMANFYPSPDAPGLPAEQPPPARPLAWKDLPWLRSLSDLPLVLKGIRTVEDARLAVGFGVDGIIVSNHGGRQLDGTLSSIETLAEIVDVCGGDLEVFIDSGFRSGADILKALALGARAVGVARPMFWGLATGGSAGVESVFELLRAELMVAMLYCGQNDVRQLDDGLVSAPATWGARRTYPARSNSF